MPQVSQLSPELARGVLQLARTLSAAARNWTLYPPEHPTIAASVSRLDEPPRIADQRRDPRCRRQPERHDRLGRADRSQRAGLGRKKLRALKTHGVAALGRIQSEGAQAVLREAAQNGDRMLRKVIAAQGA